MVNYPDNVDKSILMQKDTSLKLVQQFAVEQLSQLSTHLLIFVYIVLFTLSSDGMFWASSYGANTIDKCLELILTYL